MTEPEVPRQEAEPKSNVFRTEAAEGMSSPSNRLDQLLRVTSPRGWLALIGLVAVVAAVVLYALMGRVATTVSGTGLLLPPGGLVHLDATVAGRVSAVSARAGSPIATGEEIATITDRRGEEVSVVSTLRGHVTEVLVNEGNVVVPGNQLAVVEPLTELATAVVYFPSGEGKAIERGMPARISPSTAPSEQYGQIVGRVVDVSEFPVSSQRLEYVLDNDVLVREISSLGSVLEVTIELERDSSAPSGFEWTSGDGPPFPVYNGTLASASVITESQVPAEILLDPHE